MTPPELSIVVPALDEEENLPILIDEIDQTIVQQGIDTELIIVDDGSSDRSPELLAEAMATRPWLKPKRHAEPMGQSAAMHTGIQAATGRYVATLDADLQNDPADLVGMLEKLRADQADMVQGDRSQNRQDNIIRRYGSVVGRMFRRAMLGDTIRDTGCSARVLRADIAKQYPLQYKGIHRFLPVYASICGARVIQTPVNHRPRLHGTPKYGMGVLSRAFAGLRDLMAVRWMRSRLRQPDVSTLHAAPPPAEP